MTLLYIIIYKNASYLVLHLGQCMDCWHGKYEQLWLHGLHVIFGNLKVLIYLVLYYLGNIDAKHFWQELLLRILWIFGCCNTLWNYLEVNNVFWMHWTCKLLMWLYPYTVMLVITLSWWQQAKLETHTLYDTGKSLSVWVRPLPMGQKTVCKRGTVRYVIPCYPLGGWGKR